MRIPPQPFGTDPHQPASPTTRTRCGVWYREGVRPPETHATHIVTMRVGGVVGFVMFCGSWRRAIDVRDHIMSGDPVEVRALTADDYR